MLDSEENQQAATKFNEEMKDQIAAGEVKPMTPDKVHQAKCQLQCICKLVLSKLVFNSNR